MFQLNQVPTRIAWRKTNLTLFDKIRHIANKPGYPFVHRIVSNQFRGRKGCFSILTHSFRTWMPVQCTMFVFMKFCSPIKQQQPLQSWTQTSPLQIICYLASLAYEWFCSNTPKLENDEMLNQNWCSEHPTSLCIRSIGNIDWFYSAAFWDKFQQLVFISLLSSGHYGPFMPFLLFTFSPDRRNIDLL